MRPTRFTKKPRRTKFGKGGWHIRWRWASYTDPITGMGWASDGGIREVIKMRERGEKAGRMSEQMLAVKKQSPKRVTFED